MFILPRAYRLGRKAIRVLDQAAPENIDLTQLRNRLSAIKGVEDVHDLHVWSLTSDMPVASVHLTAPTGADDAAVLDQARGLLRDEFGVTHATLQIDRGIDECTELTW